MYLKTLQLRGAAGSSQGDGGMEQVAGQVNHLHYNCLAKGMWGVWVYSTNTEWL